MMAKMSESRVHRSYRQRVVLGSVCVVALSSAVFVFWAIHMVRSIRATRFAPVNVSSVLPDRFGSFQDLLKTLGANSPVGAHQDAAPSLELQQRIAGVLKEQLGTPPRPAKK